MSRVVQLTGIVDDGTLGPAVPVLLEQPIQTAYGENLTIHLVLKNPSGRQVVATPQRIVTYGARTKPLPTGQSLFQHIAVISPLGDGAWDCAIVPADYQWITTGSGRFVFDIWLTDNSLATPQNNPVQALSPWIVTPSAVSVTSPSTAPVPAPTLVLGLPAPGPSGYYLQTIGTTGGLLWSPLEYSPTSPLSWPAGSPTMVAGALDALAARTYVSRISDAAFPQYALVMPSATNAGRVLAVPGPSAIGLFTGVAFQSASAAGQTVQVLEEVGVQSPMLSDGTTAIGRATLITPSSVAPGFVAAGIANIVGVSLGTVASGASGAAVNVL